MGRRWRAPPEAPGDPAPGPDSRSRVQHYRRQSGPEAPGDPAPGPERRAWPNLPPTGQAFVPQQGATSTGRHWGRKKGDRIGTPRRATERGSTAKGDTPWQSPEQAATGPPPRGRGSTRTQLAVQRMRCGGRACQAGRGLGRRPEPAVHTPRANACATPVRDRLKDLLHAASSTRTAR